MRSLRACGALTPALLLRSLLGGERDLFAGALAELSGAAADARRRLHPRSARRRLCRARPQGWPEERHLCRPSAPRLPRSRLMSARPATGSSCRWCKRSSTNANGATIRRWPKSWRCSGASPPRRRGRKPPASPATRSRRRPSGGCRATSTSLPPTTTPRETDAEPRISTRCASARRNSNSAPWLADPIDDRAPRIELPLALIAALDDAA